MAADSLAEDTDYRIKKQTTRSFCRNFGSLLFSLQGVPQLLQADPSLAR